MSRGIEAWWGKGEDRDDVAAMRAPLCRESGSEATTKGDFLTKTGCACCYSTDLCEDKGKSRGAYSAATP